MPFRDAHRIDELSSMVADADVVLTHDAPLSQALNHRIREPRIGRFATTPRTRVTDEFNPRDERRVFHHLVAETDLDWRDAAFAISTIFDCWDETGAAETILEFDQFDRPLIREALAAIRDVPNARNALATFQPAADEDTAVIGEEFLPELDRKAIPSSATRASPFTTDTVAIPPFRILPSGSQIVDTLLANITPEIARKVAVVMNRNGPYPALVESAFEAADIPYSGGPGFGDDPGVRTCLAVARAAWETGTLRLQDLRGVLGECGIESSPVDLEKRVDTLDAPEIREVTQFIESVEERSFEELLTTVEGWTDKPLSTFRTELDALDILDCRITADRVADLGFYLEAFDVPVERDNEGVLLADATTATYVDRPVVYYLGMDADWTRSVPDRPWIDNDERDRRQLDAFELLLQNGRKQIFLVQEERAGVPIAPCLYFHELIPGAFQHFTDHDHARHRNDVSDSATAFQHVPIEARPDPPTTLSQSALNTLANSPLDYCFDQLVDGPDRDYFRKGTLFHDYAEFYSNHRQFSDRLARDELVEVMMAEMEPFLDKPARTQLATEFRVGTEIIERFIRERPPVMRRYEGYRANFWSNVFADHFDRPVTAPVTEQWFQNHDIGVSGVVDLIRGPTELIDYKSGRGRSIKQIVNRSQVEPPVANPDFQAILYLAHHRRVVPDERIDFVFFHFLDVLDDAITGEYSLDDALVRVSYDPRPFWDYVASRDAFDHLTSGVSENNARRKTLERLGFATYRDFFDGVDAADFPNDTELHQSELAARFRERLIDEVGDYQYVKRGATSTLKALDRRRDRMYFPEDLDAFESFVTGLRDNLEEYHRTWFPAGDPDVDSLRHPDMVRTDG